MLPAPAVYEHTISDYPPHGASSLYITPTIQTCMIRIQERNA